MSQTKISAVIITKNEEKNIQDCLESILWCDEIIVVDSGSEDQTIPIAKNYNVKLIQKEWLGFGKTKQFAVNSATGKWILSIDADETVSPELKTKIISLIKKSPEFYGYKIKRNTFYLGKKIQFSGWQTDYPTRLFLKEKGCFNEKTVHESVIIEQEKYGILEEPIYHYSYPQIKTHISKMNLYTSLAAEESFQNNKKSSISSSLVRGILKFLKCI